MIGVQHNLTEFNLALQHYLQLSGKTPEDVLTKQGGKLGFALRTRLRGITPAKGQVRQERLTALKAGEGVRVRPRVRLAILQKFGAATDVGTRRAGFVQDGKVVGSFLDITGTGGRKYGRFADGGKGRGARFSGVGSRFGRMNLQALMVQREINTREQGRAFLAVSARYPRTLRLQQLAASRYGPILSEAGLNANRDTLTFQWDAGKSELSGQAAGALDKPKGRYAIALALRDTTADILEYVNRKLDENAKKVGLK